MSQRFAKPEWSTGIRLFSAILVPFLMILSAPALSQVVIDRGERLDSDRPEAWAMAYLSAATLFSGFGTAGEGEPWSLSVGAEAGHIPHLSTEQRRVGFDGTKLEDLNKSPVFGRIRAGVVLPADFSFEFSWTPPVRIEGAKPRRLIGAALERPIFEHGPWRSAARLFYQHGTVSGDITCDRDTASHEPGSPENPFGCREPSNDRFRINHHGLELSLSRRFEGAGVEPYLSYAYTRMKPRTEVRARTFEVLDRSVLTTRINTHTATAGVVYRPAEHWEVLGALAWTPLHSRRPPDNTRSNDDLLSARFMVRRWWR